MSEIEDEAYSEVMAENEWLRAENARLKDKIGGLEKLNQMTDDAVIMELKAEIERLKEDLWTAKQDIGALAIRRTRNEALLSVAKVLLTRAADALECHNLDHLQDELIAELRKAAQ